ncbi:DUF1648 domain-containing protein [Microbacterium jejuense]|uniref:DUF1648 domain-containing protein n=1 Tax=Microbacterium jejuense TaxID=1263637 RepID=A0ABS7HL78_9MICO|nr:DUF1648 domain-containing protein [Microbacterium jejuense]MBW9093485.1 DUF1648 domain-containing protein [Microbacterium jejuense]
MTRPDPAVRRFVLVAIWLPLAIVVVGVAVQMIALPHLPPTIAVHWNASGQADGFAPAWTQPLVTVLLGLGLPLLMALTSLGGLRRGDRGPTYRLMGASAAAVSALVTVALTATLAMQIGLDAASQAPTVWIPLVVSLVAAAIVGVGAWFLQPGTAAPDAATRPATPLALGPNERALWMRTTSMTTGAAVAVVAAVLLVAAGAVAAWVGGAEPVTAWLLTGVALVLLFFAATTLAFHVRVDDGGLAVDSVLGIPRFRVALADVQSAARVRVTPMGEFGGWGLRIAPHGRRFGIVLRTGEALEVTRRSGRRFVVTVDDAETGAALLEALAQRAAARP